MRLAVEFGRFHQSFVDFRKVVCHQRTIIGQGTTRINKREQYGLAAILCQTNAFAVLIHQCEIRHSGWLLGRRQLGARRRCFSVGLLHHEDIFQVDSTRTDYHVCRDLIADGYLV